MTFLELWDTQLDIELGSQQTSLFTAALRKAAVNNAMQAFVRQTGCTKKYTYISMTDGEGEYNVHALLTDWIRLADPPSIKKVSGGKTTWIQGPKDFRRYETEELDRLETGWRAASASTPIGWYLRRHEGQLLIGVYPPPDITSGDTWDLLVPYVAKPTNMVGDSTEPFTVGGTVFDDLEPYHQALVHWAAAQLEPLRKNYQAVQYQMGLYNYYVAEYLRQQRQDGPDQITLMRDYYDEGERGGRAMDPRRYP